MPNDPITGAPAAAAAADPTAAAPAAAPQPIASAQYVGREELANFSQQLVQAVDTSLRSFGQQINQGRGAAQPAQPAAAADPAADKANILMRLAEGDLSGIDQRVIETLKGTGVLDFLSTQADSAAETNLSTARSSIDAEFGSGTFDKEIKPLVEAHLGTGRAARANPQAVNLAVAAAKGMKFAELTAAKTARETAAATARTAEETRMRANAPWMPGNGWTPTQANVLSDDDAATLRRMTDQVGADAAPKPEQAAKLRDLLWQSGHDGVSISQLATLFPQSR